MFKVVDCFTEEHNLWLVALAGAICLTGCALTVQSFSQLRRAPADRRALHVALVGVIGGSTIWTTHFVAMAAYDPVVAHAYEPMLTVASLFVAIVGVTLAFAIATWGERGAMIESGGVVFGLSVSVMHYTGMQAFQVPGRIVWDQSLIAASVLLGAGLGALALHLAGRPRGRWSAPAAMGAMMLAICAMHFTGMGAVTVELDPTVPAPAEQIPESVLTGLVIAVMSLFLFVGLIAFLIETKTEAQADEAFARATLHDALTGLPNRLYLNRTLEQAARLFECDPDCRVALVTIDLDRFKEINDMHGHAAGDAILKAVGARMEASMSFGEFVARVGGDEFVAVKMGYDRLSEVKSFAERLAAQVIEPVIFGPTELHVGASVGVAAYPEHGDKVDILLNNSDLAMFRAKQGGIEAVCFFDQQMDQQSRDRMGLTQDLRQALDRDEFELHYQLQNEVQSREVVGFEVLLRWNHPTRGRVSPGDFIPLAENTGLIRPIGLRVLRTACREAASWPRPFRIAVNVAPQQLVQPSFVEHVADALMESGLDPTRLELEITEASIIDDQKNTLEVMHRLKAMGVRIAMDDFGTGYSSLASLRSFPFDKIKIDRSFVRDVHQNPQSSAIVRSTLLLGAALKIPILAEGVETEDELSFLSVEKCAEVQGFLFGKPLTVGEVRALMATIEEKTSDSEAPALEKAS
ncbi:MAG: EAL domain-containing protein [Pseudomonadota bacterium]